MRLLNDLLDWPEVLSLLGAPEATACVLPREVPCLLPPCPGTMRIVHSRIGPWSSCSGCGFTGTLLDLVSRRWGSLGSKSTVDKLQELGVFIPDRYTTPDGIQTLLEYPNRVRETFKSLWDKAAIRFLADDSKELRTLQRKLRIQPDRNRERWLRGMGQYVGYADLDMMRAFKSTLRGFNTKIPGLDDKSVPSMIVPLYDLPGNLSEFIMYGQPPELSKDVITNILRPLSAYGRNVKNYVCGLLMYSTMGRNPVILNDPITTLRLQDLHLQDNAQPAPIGSLYSSFGCSSDPDIWLRHNLVPVFWGAITPELLRHARTANARICTIGFNADGPIVGTLDRPLLEWVTKVHKSAKPWEDVLEAYLLKLTPGGCEELLRAAGFSSSDITEYLKGGTAALREHLKDLELFNGKSVWALVGDAQYEERGGKWWKESGELLSDVVLRIDEVRMNKRTNGLRYTGRVCYQGEEHPYNVPAEEVDFKWLGNFVLAKGLGPATIPPTEHPYAARTALAFHRPVVLHDGETVGWDRDLQSFVLPHQRIQAGGKVFPHSSVDTNVRYLPARNLATDFQLTPGEITHLDCHPALTTIVAILTGVVSGVIGPALNKATAGTIVAIESFPLATRELLKNFGCAELSVARMWNKDFATPAEAVTMMQQHRWPYLVRSADLRIDTWQDWLTDNGTPRNCIALGNWLTGLTMAMTPGWRMIGCTTDVPRLKPDIATKLVPNVLAYLSCLDYQLPAPVSQPYEARVALLIRDWLRNQGIELNINDVLLRVLSADPYAWRNRLGPCLLGLLARLRKMWGPSSHHTPGFNSFLRALRVSGGFAMSGEILEEALDVLHVFRDKRGNYQLPPEPWISVYGPLDVRLPLKEPEPRFEEVKEEPCMTLTT